MADLQNYMRKGQLPINCQLCEVSPSIKWKCLDCGLLLCENCKINIHPKIKNAKDHKIIDVKEIGSHSKETDLANISCAYHSPNKCCLYCKTCCCLVCPVCVTQNHQKHDLVEIREVYNEKIQVLRYQKDAIEKRIEKMVTKRTLLLDHQKLQVSNLAITEKSVDDFEKLLLKEVGNFIRRLRSNINETGNDLEREVSRDKEAILCWVTEAESRSSSIETLIQTTDGEEFFRELEQLQVHLNKFPKTNSELVLAPSLVKNVPTTFGKLKASNEADTCKTSIQVISKFTTELNRVGCIALSGKNLLWISSNSDCTLQCLKIGTKGIRIERSIQCAVCDLSADPTSGDLFITPDPIEKTYLSTIKNGSFSITESTFNSDPYCPMGVKVSGKGKILVGTYSRCESEGFVLMNKKGVKEVHCTFDDHFDQPVTFLDLAITKHELVHVAISETNFDDSSKIVVFGTNNKILNTYPGHRVINKDKYFYPSDLVSTNKDNVIALDKNTHTLHVLNDHGELLTYFDTVAVGIENPYSLEVGQEDEFYIGCSRTEHKKAELFTVTLPY